MVTEVKVPKNQIVIGIQIIKVVVEEVELEKWRIWAATELLSADKMIKLPKVWEYCSGILKPTVPQVCKCSRGKAAEIYVLPTFQNHQTFEQG